MAYAPSRPLSASTPCSPFPLGIARLLVAPELTAPLCPLQRRRALEKAARGRLMWRDLDRDAHRLVSWACALFPTLYGHLRNWSLK